MSFSVAKRYYAPCSQLQLKQVEGYLSCYLCLASWHDFKAFLDLTVGFRITLEDGPQVLQTTTAKRTFRDQHDGWGWDKYVVLENLSNCTEVLFVVHFIELGFSFSLVCGYFLVHG